MRTKHIDWLIPALATMLASMVALGQLLPPTQSVVKRYAAVKVLKQASLLMSNAVAQTNNIIGLTASLMATNEIQFTSDLTTGTWTTVAIFAWPSFQTNVSAQGQAGFYRLKTTWANGTMNMISTNIQTP